MGDLALETLEVSLVWLGTVKRGDQKTAKAAKSREQKPGRDSFEILGKVRPTEEVRAEQACALGQGQLRKQNQEDARIICQA